MRKSKYLILSSFYFNFNDNLSKIIKINELFKKQNILDLFRFDKIKIIIAEEFSKHENFNFIYLPVSIEKINEYAFWNCKIQILDLSNCINLKNIERSAFYKNQIKQLKLPENIEIINSFSFYENQIKILDLSNCIKLKNIRNSAFCKNQIKHLKLPKNIEKIELCAFMNNQIQILDLSNCINLKNIGIYAFEENQIKQLKLPKNIEEIYKGAFRNNKIESIDLLNCTKLKYIFLNIFFNNPLNEIKILDNVIIEYNNYAEYKDDMWNKFAIYYNDNNKKEGDYKLENDEWKWYPL